MIETTTWTTIVEQNGHWRRSGDVVLKGNKGLRWSFCFFLTGWRMTYAHILPSLQVNDHSIIDDPGRWIEYWIVSLIFTKKTQPQQIKAFLSTQILQDRFSQQLRDLFFSATSNLFSHEKRLITTSHHRSFQDTRVRLAVAAAEAKPLKLEVEGRLSDLTMYSFDWLLLLLLLLSLLLLLQVVLLLLLVVFLDDS